MLKATRRIGASKLATVSEAQMPDGSLVAVKCFDRQNLSSFKHDRFFGAAKIWKSLSSPLLVRYIDVKPDTSEIIQELWDRSAAVRLGEGNSDPKLVFHVLRDILRALAFLHGHGYLHANIKPTNVFFSPRGQALLSDGLLVNIHSPSTLPPPINQKYLTPELTNDAYGSMSPSTDLYSAGFLALELLAGDRFGRAFQGVGDDAADDDLAWFQWHGSSLAAPDANLFAKSCPTELTRVIRKLVTKNPNDRYHSAEDALADLPDSLIVAPQATSPSERKKLRRELLASHILERPTNGVVLVIASGARAGEMIGTDLSRFSVGYHDDCLVRFQSDKPSEAQARVVFLRGPDGWSVCSEQDGRVYVNEQALSEERPLRSGDIIRLSANGPDLQFTLQSGGFDIPQLVKRFLPEQPTATEVRAPMPASGLREENTIPSGLPRSPHSAPAGPFEPSAHQRPAPPNRSKLDPQPPNAPQPREVSSQRNPSIPAGNPLPPRRSPPPSSAKGKDRRGGETGQNRPAPPASKNARTSPNNQSAKPLLDASWFQPKHWSKQQKNWAMLIGGMCLIALILLLPSSEPAPKQEDRKKPNNATGSSKVPTAVDPEQVKPTEPDARPPAPKTSSEANPFNGLDDDPDAG